MSNSWQALATVNKRCLRAHLSPGGLLKWNTKHSTFKQMAGIPFAAAPESPAAFFPRPLVAAILISWAALKQRNVKLTSAPLAVG